MSVYYNENDPQMVAWLRELIRQRLIADGDVDDRSIELVRPADLRGFAQCHFFAGIGGWSLGLRLAGVPDDFPCWTGSCPCQPFSAAGKGDGEDDPRDLWPAWFRLVRECRPDLVFGEQVEAAARGGWFDRLCADLEGENYAVGAVVLGAHSVGAYHIRQRLWFVAQSERAERGAWIGRWPAAAGAGAGELAEPDRTECTPRVDESVRAAAPRSERITQAGVSHDVADADEGRQRIDGCQTANGQAPFREPHAQLSGESSGLVYGECQRLERLAGHGNRSDESGRLDTGASRSVAEASGAHSVANATDGRRAEHEHDSRKRSRSSESNSAERAGASFWDAADWLPCRDGKARPVEPGTFPLAHGVPARVGRLRGYGNAIVPHVAAEFVQAYLACRV